MQESSIGVLWQMRRNREIERLFSPTNQLEDSSPSKISRGFYQDGRGGCCIMVQSPDARKRLEEQLHPVAPANHCRKHFTSE